MSTFAFTSSVRVYFVFHPSRGAGLELAGREMSQRHTDLDQKGVKTVPTNLPHLAEFSKSS
jgi:hypothetical protein